MKIRSFFYSLILLATMAMPAFSQVWIWSQTATTNGNVDPSINWQEGMPPSAVDDSARATMAGVAKWRDDGNGLVTLGGTLTAYTATTNQGNQSGNVSSLTPGYRTCFSPNVVNGAAPTLQVDGQAAKPLRLAPATNLIGGELRIGTPYCATYFSSNGGEYILNEFYAPIISAGSISYAQIQNVGASRLLGNPTGSPASMSEISLGQGLGFSGTSVLVPNLAITTGLINTSAVTYGKIQNESNATILGNDSGGAAAPGELTLGAGLSFLSSTSVGIGTGALTSGMYAAGSVNTAALGASQVTYAKIQNESNATILGNDSGGAAAPGELTLASSLAFITSTSVGVANGGIGTAQLAAGAVTYAKIQNESNATLLGNDSGGAAAPREITLGTGLQFSSATVLATNYFTPNIQTFTSGSSLTYTTPTNGGNLPIYLRVRMVAGGGGGGAANTNNGTAGSNSSFASWTTVGGSAGTPGNGVVLGGTGGTNSTGTLVARIPGSAGLSQGGISAGGAGGGGFGVTSYNQGGSGAGSNAPANTGSGGSGGVNSGSSAIGGGGGEYVEFIITSPAASYTYTVGGGGSGGAAGAQAGGNGSAGYIAVEAFWQ